MYYGGVGFQAIVPFEELQPEFLNGQCNGHHGPYLTPFHYITDFHANFHIVHVDLQTGHVDLHNGYVAFAEWSCGFAEWLYCFCIMVMWICRMVMDNRFRHLPKLGLVDSTNRSLNQCWPVLEQRSGYQPPGIIQSTCRFHFQEIPNQKPTWPGIRVFTYHVDTLLARY